MKILIKGRKIRIGTKIFKIILNRINHSIASKNILTNPQLVIFSFCHIGLSVNLEGRYENSPLLLVEEFIKKKMPYAKDKTALDIGANIGNHSLFFANNFNDVYAFEPNPVTFEVLQINCKFASANKNIIPLNFGLSDIKGRLPFYINHSIIGGIGGSAIINTKNENIDDAIQIDVKRLDDLMELKDADIALIKIDVEGHEINVLNGAKNTIIKNMPAILFEQHASEIIDGSSFVVKFLEELGYEFFTIKKNFYYGDSVVAKISSLACQTVFGERLDFVKVKKFKKTFYEMILAMPKS